ncbi:MAG: hypothetical protein HW418_2610, partial [Anaerolineales bacterium]|nr:hypothetical protein [Anaerolineales bacterium]
MLSPTRPLSPLLPRSTAPLLAVAALALGLLIARLPPEYSLALIVGAALAGVAAWEPALGIGLA